MEVIFKKHLNGTALLQVIFPFLVVCTVIFQPLPHWLPFTLFSAFATTDNTAHKNPSYMSIHTSVFICMEKNSVVELLGQRICEAFKD